MSDKELRHLVSVSAFQRGEVWLIHRLTHRILVTSFRPDQLASVTIARLYRLQRYSITTSRITFVDREGFSHPRLVP